MITSTSLTKLPVKIGLKYVYLDLTCDMLRHGPLGAKSTPKDFVYQFASKSFRRQIRKALHKAGRSDLAAETVVSKPLSRKAKRELLDSYLRDRNHQEEYANDNYQIPCACSR